jgi:hypothetical protein
MASRKISKKAAENRQLNNYPFSIMEKTLWKLSSLLLELLQQVFAFGEILVHSSISLGYLKSNFWLTFMKLST